MNKGWNKVELFEVNNPPTFSEVKEFFDSKFSNVRQKLEFKSDGFVFTTPLTDKRKYLVEIEDSDYTVYQDTDTKLSNSSAQFCIMFDQMFKAYKKKLRK